MFAISRAVFEVIIQCIHKMCVWSNSLGAVPGLHDQVRALYRIFSALNPGMYLRVDKSYFINPHVSLARSVLMMAFLQMGKQRGGVEVGCWLSGTPCLCVLFLRFLCS